MDFQKNQLVLQSGRCQTNGKKKRIEINQPNEKIGGFFAVSISKLEEMICYLVLFID